MDGVLCQVFVMELERTQPFSVHEHARAEALTHKSTDHDT